MKAAVVQKRLEQGRADSRSRVVANGWYLSPSERAKKKHGGMRLSMKLFILCHSYPLPFLSTDEDAKTIYLNNISPSISP